jgi:hypothetical protein
MKKIISTVCAVCALILVSSGTTLRADNSNFAGPYIGVSGLALGAGVSGKSRAIADDGNGSTGNSEDSVNAGQVALATGLEVGYALPLGSVFLLDIGGSYLTGEAKISHQTSDPVARSGEDGSGQDVSFAIDKIATAYISPTIALSDTSSVYLKWGVSSADVGVSGDITVPGNLGGETLALGTRIVLDSGIFIRTEAGYTDYNEISSRGKGNTIDSTTSYSAKPTIAYGKVSLGMRF